MKKNSLKKNILSLVRFILGKTNLDVYPHQANYHYVPDYFGRAAAKGIDILKIHEFRELAEIPIHDKRTLLYYDRLYVIYQSLAQLNRINVGNVDIDIAEIGTYRGGTTYFMASVQDSLGLKVNKIHCFDTFEGHSAQDLSTQFDYRLHTPNFFGDVNFEEVKQYLGKFNAIEAHKGRFQDTCTIIRDRQFGFIHVDVDLYEPTRFILDFFDSRLIKGGMMVVDDYGTRSCPGVIQAVQEFISQRSSYFLFHPFTEQCILIKL